MVKYEIVGKFPDNALIDNCLSILETNGITELPVLPNGEKRILFSDERTKITFNSEGNRLGYFTLRQTSGELTSFFTSTNFKY